ncbi:MAG: SusD/RagB family nutrient-binding outer membrane lipoprotein [Chitinophagaceae bacterium]|nr:SusD/RagB family nutrient-binding outer membrane lipoprotein [Chitinophagaceae bacterium]
MKKLMLGLSIACLLFATSCKKVLDINDNPNAPTEASITPNLILPAVLHNTATQVATGYEFTARWMGYWARSGSFGPVVEEETYNITATFNWGVAQWRTWYGILYDVHIVEQKAIASGEDFYRGIAKILKAIGFMYLVDSYNNVPYSKAFDLASNVLPGYDNGRDIYADLLNQLDEAVTLIENTVVGNNYGISEADVMFGGNKLRWQQLANTQKLKMIIRQSELDGFSPPAEIAEITANGKGFIPAGMSANVQPGYMKDNNKQNPYWNSHKLTFTDDETDPYNRANNYLLNLYRNNDDIRYMYVFEPAVSPIGGNIYYGYDYGTTATNNPLAANSSAVAGIGLAKSPTQPQWLFTSVESMFLQAEAIQRGWLSGDPQSAYQNAVRESFVWLNVGGNEAQAILEANLYLTSRHAIANWMFAQNDLQRLELIVTQRYLALVGINNFEAWADYRRLCVPNVPLSIAPNKAANIPVRLRYPQDEYNFNSANVAAQGNPNPLTSRVFWDN